MTDRTEEATQLLMKLCKEEIRDEILDARTQIYSQHRTLLLEVGETSLHHMKGRIVDPERKKHLNSALALVDCYLCSIECALIKIEFLKELLDPTSDSKLVQDQVPYQTMLEELLAVQGLHAESILHKNPDLDCIIQPSVFDKTRGVRGKGILHVFRSMCVMQPPTLPTQQSS